MNQPQQINFRMFRTILLAGFLGVAFGACPDIFTKPDFDASQYVGDWYEIQRIETIFQYQFYCVRARYEALAPGVIGVLNTATRPSGEFTGITGTATQFNASAPGEFVLTFPGQPDGKYLVLDTDYTTFAAVYSCDDYGSITAQFGWLLSRTNTLPQETIDSAMESFGKFGVDTTVFQKFYQGDDCIYDEPTTDAPAQ